MIIKSKGAWIKRNHDVFSFNKWILSWLIQLLIKLSFDWKLSCIVLSNCRLFSLYFSFFEICKSWGLWLKYWCHWSWNLLFSSILPRSWSDWRLLTKSWGCNTKCTWRPRSLFLLQICVYLSIDLVLARTWFLIFNLLLREPPFGWFKGWRFCTLKSFSGFLISKICSWA